MAVRPGVDLEDYNRASLQDQGQKGGIIQLARKGLNWRDYQPLPASGVKGDPEPPKAFSTYLLWDLGHPHIGMMLCLENIFQECSYSTWGDQMEQINSYL